MAEWLIWSFSAQEKKPLSAEELELTEKTKATAMFGVGADVMATTDVDREFDRDRQVCVVRAYVFVCASDIRSECCVCMRSCE